MADHSAIEWTDATWNPTVGCSIVSPGCTNCYAMNVAAGLERRFGSEKYRGLTKSVNGNDVWTGEVRLDETALLQPLKWKKGRRIFVNSMSDLFHESLSDEQIDRVLAVMALAPQHTFQVPTKRAERMRGYLSCIELNNRVGSLMAEISDGADRDGIRHDHPGWSFERPPARPMPPLPSVWLGVSAERQQEADERIPHLLATPAVVRFVSLEPLLGPIDLIGTLARYQDSPQKRDCAVPLGRQLLDWIIVGGESGKNARPMDMAWADGIVEQCRAANVACFVKQLGTLAMSDGYPLELRHSKGGDPNEWPDRLRVRQLPGDLGVAQSVLEPVALAPASRRQASEGAL